MARTWTFQDHRQVQKHGRELAAHCVGFYDLDGNRRSIACGTGDEGLKAAEEKRKQIAKQLDDGTYEQPCRKTWQDFRAEYEKWIAGRVRAGTVRIVGDAFDHFERLVKPQAMSRITSRRLDQYTTERMAERGHKKGSTLSAASMNKELRHLRAAFNKAAKWKYMPESPEVDFVKQRSKMPTYIPAEDFAAIYNACDVAKYPDDQNYSASDWWRALLVHGYMTGWRINEMRALPTVDLDLDAGKAITDRDDNKGGRDEVADLHPLVVEHLRRIKSFGRLVFPWNHGDKLLYTEFARIQREAGVKPPRGKDAYTFHDLRRSFATENCELPPTVLQKLMRHKAFATTQGYIDVGKKIKGRIADIFVPDLTKRQAQ